MKSTKDELMWLDATASALLIKNRSVSASEMTEAAISRIEQIDPQVNAMVYERFDAARREARIIDSESSRTENQSNLPFSGVPILVKDLGADAIGEPSYCGSALLKARNATSTVETNVRKRLTGAGFIVLGKTSTPELGLASDTSSEAHGVTRNPWDLSRTPGGSSGGSAAAVSSGMVSVAHGGDGGGSIRMPASHCGLVGLKVTRGRISAAPAPGEGNFGHSTPGVLTRTVRDTASVLDLLAGYEAGDPSLLPNVDGGFAVAMLREPGRLKIGVATSSGDEDHWPTHPEVQQAVRHTAGLLEALGHDVDGDSSPDDLFDPSYWRHWFNVLSTGVARRTSDLLSLPMPFPDGVSEQGFESITRHWAENGKSMSAIDLAVSLDWLDAFRRRVLSWWSTGFDILVAPVYLAPPPVIGQLWKLPEAYSVEVLRFTPQINTTGQPAISLPLHWTKDGLPIGVQLIAPHGREDLLLQLARQLEDAAPWADRHPDIFGLATSKMADSSDSGVVRTS